MKRLQPKVLLIEDDQDHADLIAAHLESVGRFLGDWERVASLQAGLERLERGGIDVVLLDLSLPDSGVTETLPRMIRKAPQLPLVVLTSLNNLELALDAVKQGAQDYLVKAHLSGDLLLRSIQYAIERKRYAAELERSNQELKHFAHTVAHEIRSPLANALYACELLRLKGDGALDEQSRECVRQIREAVGEMSTLVDQLLQFANVGGRQTHQPVDSGDMLNQALANLRAVIVQNQATITHGPLPVVRADATQLKLLFQNLVSNAIKFRSDRLPEVRIDAERTGDTGWHFTVRDNGSGFDPRFHDRLFTMFQRLPGAEHHPGTGIGLAFCQRIVENHGGRLWADSAPGQGSTFHFTLQDPG